LTPLHKDGIVSTKDYNAALQAYELAKASYSSSAASGVASAPISGTIVELLVKQGDYVEAGQPIATISDNASLNLKVDLPEKYAALQSQITDANVKLPYSDEYITLSSINGHRVSGTVAAVSSQPGYIPVYFSFNNDGSFIAGSFVDVYLIGALKDNAIVVPVTALSEQQGNFFVYSKIDAEGYKKIHVTIGNSDGNNVEITSGLKGGEIIVVKGAPIIKLAESSGAVPEGHNHNH
jgi:RND family efflux transporter MFP subunit